MREHGTTEHGTPIEQWNAKEQQNMKHWWNSRKPKTVAEQWNTPRIATEHQQNTPEQ